MTELKSSSKPAFRQILVGEFTPPQLKKYIIIKALLIWFFVFLAYLSYPPSEFSILEATFSYLGSFDPDRNPEGFYFLTIALIIMGIMFVPLILYRHRRMVAIEPWSVRMITILMLIGCLGMALVGIFPDTGADYFQDLANRKIHNMVSILGFGGFGLGVMWESLVMGKDRFAKWPLSFGRGGRRLLEHRKLQGPYITFWILAVLAGGFLGGWELVYPIMHAQDPSIGHWPGIGPFSFPLWEWILIVYLFVFMYWVVLTLPEKPPTKK